MCMDSSVGGSWRAVPIAAAAIVVDMAKGRTARKTVSGKKARQLCHVTVF